MNKKLLLLFLILLIVQAGCIKSMRYSHDEIKDFPPYVQEHIKNGEIAVGMTELQVRYSWGGPNTVTVLPPADSGKERVEWVYEKFRVFKTRLVFTDHKLTEIISAEPGIAR